MSRFDVEIRALPPYNLDADVRRFLLTQLVPAHAYGDELVRRGVEEELLSKALVSLPPACRTLAVLDRMRLQWACDEIGFGIPGDEDYLAPRSVWLAKLTITLTSDELAHA